MEIIKIIENKKVDHSKNVRNIRIKIFDLFKYFWKYDHFVTFVTVYPLDSSRKSKVNYVNNFKNYIRRKIKQDDSWYKHDYWMIFIKEKGDIKHQDHYHGIVISTRDLVCIHECRTKYSYIDAKPVKFFKQSINYITKSLLDKKSIFYTDEDSYYIDSKLQVLKIGRKNPEDDMLPTLACAMDKLIISVVIN